VGKVGNRTLMTTFFVDSKAQMFTLPGTTSHQAMPFSVDSVEYKRQQWGAQDLEVSTLRMFSETANLGRYLRTTNPVFRYDYKLGNYFTKEDMTTKPFLFTTINELTGGIRKAS
jgi:hypothetical protein